MHTCNAVHKHTHTHTCTDILEFCCDLSVYSCFKQDILFGALVTPQGFEFLWSSLWNQTWRMMMAHCARTPFGLLAKTMVSTCLRRIAYKNHPLILGRSYPPLAVADRLFRGLRLLLKACHAFLPTLAWSMVLLGVIMSMSDLRSGNPGVWSVLFESTKFNNSSKSSYLV